MYLSWRFPLFVSAQCGPCVGKGADGEHSVSITVRIKEIQYSLGLLAIEGVLISILRIIKRNISRWRPESPCPKSEGDADVYCYPTMKSRRLIQPFIVMSHLHIRSSWDSEYSVDLLRSVHCLTSLPLLLQPQLSIVVTCQAQEYHHAKVCHRICATSSSNAMAIGLGKRFWISH